MNKLRTLLALAVLAPMLAACAPSPEKVCDHVYDLMKTELGDEVEAMSDEQIEKMKSGCVEDAQKDKEKDLKAYKNRTKCVMKATSLEDLRDCEKQEKEAKK